jgi:GTP-binding protein
MRFHHIQHFNEYQIPPDSPIAGMPQVAVVGRSNAGKSTLINALLDWKGAARTSSRPGRTQEVHFFLLDRALLLADLPGYGYAKVSKTLRREWSTRMLRYLDGAASLEHVFLIMDCRRDPGPDELWLLERFARQGVGVTVLANKTDRIKKSAVKPRLAALFELFRAMGHGTRIVGVSAKTRAGIEPILSRLHAMIPPAEE